VLSLPDNHFKWWCEYIGYAIVGHLLTETGAFIVSVDQILIAPRNRSQASSLLWAAFRF
jgi:hypothetical protein